MLVCASCGHENSEGAKFCEECGFSFAAAVAGRKEQRKAVTVLFCDLSGSTALGETLDPERLRTLLARYFERMKMIVESHGGAVEKFIGDAVMAVFGVPVVHEDDALRALRAAVEMRDALPDLGVQGRIGVMTGEVVTGTAERLATGDAVNVAARLEQAAQAGEILIGDETYRLARDAVEVEKVEPLQLKGKSEPVVAHRLLSVRGEEGFSRRPDSPMVGRETELRRLRDAFDQATRDGSCQLFTILGPAGVGKSRLVAEFLASLDDALVVRGRCLPYGEGITYWPVVEVVKQLPETETDPVAAKTIRAFVSEEQMFTSSEEIAWAFRKLLEAMAAKRPLVCVFDDVHWGEETFLDLVEHVADLSRDAPILLLCMARPELLDLRASWAGGKVNATNVLLEPLGPQETELLLGSLAHLDEGLRARIQVAAEGNPLFLEEMVALAQESSDGDVIVPPTIQALLAARLDQLDASERDVLQCGSVEGRVFHRGAVQALAPEEPQLTTRLSALVRKELVRPDKAQFVGEDAFRFRHLLIRDAAYDALPKATRAELHERFAVWLVEHGAALVEVDEIIGYHLEQAYRYREELGALEEVTSPLGIRAAERLAAAGGRALDRGDMPAAASLLERATALLSGDERLSLLPSLGRVLIERGEWDRAEIVLSEAAEAGRAEGGQGIAADAVVGLCFIKLHTDPHTSHKEMRQELEGAIRVFEELQDEAGLARALGIAGRLPFWRGEAGIAVDELERAALYAHRAGDRVQEMESLRGVLAAALHGPMPVAAALDRVADVERRTTRAGAPDERILPIRALLEAMLGRFDVARALMAEARASAEELGLETQLATGVARAAGEIELLAGDPAAAERELRPACETLERMGDWGHFASVVPYLADALWLQGRGDEALPMVDLAARWTLADDMDAQIGSRRVRAKLLAQQGDLEEAERLVLEATALAARTDYLNLHGEALSDLAEVLALAGKRDEAAAALENALEHYERKGNLVSAQRAQTRLAELQEAAPR